MSDTKGYGFEQPKIMILLVLLGTIAYVGFQVMDAAVSPAQLEQMEQVERTCAGFYGCGYTLDDWLGLIGVSAIVTVLAVIVVNLFSIRAPVKQSDARDKDPVEIAKERYVDGEIQTTVKLEQELEQTLDPDIDDATIDEIDDLLGRDNK